MSSAHKFKLKLTATKPRNPLVAPALSRKAGSHRKSSAALQRDKKMALEKQLREG